MKTALIAGAAGFIGTNLCLKLLRSYRVIGVDNLISGSKRNVVDLKRYSNFLFLEQDIAQPLKVKEKIDEIWDLACPASPVDFNKYPIEILLTCSSGVKNVLDLAVEKKAKFFHASTSEVYGDPLEHPQKESYFGHVNPVGLRSCYDEGKRFAEALIMAYFRKFKKDVRIARIFNTYGPFMKKDDGRVVSNFVNQAIDNLSLSIYGNGSQTRSFCYVSDMVEGLYSLATTDNLAGEIINIGNPEEKTILEIADIIKKLTQSKSSIIFKNIGEDDPKKRCPDVFKAKKILGWGPKIGLEEGLRLTIEYFRSL